MLYITDMERSVNFINKYQVYLKLLSLLYTLNIHLTKKMITNKYNVVFFFNTKVSGRLYIKCNINTATGMHQICTM